MIPILARVTGADATGTPPTARPATTDSAAVAVGRRLTSIPLPAPMHAVRRRAIALAWIVLEARQLTSPLRFARRELFGWGVGDYQLRSSGVRFAVCHRSGDVDIFRKSYGYRYYTWPAAVRTRLAGLGRPINTLDLGGNIGLFEVHTREQIAVNRAVAYEPDPANGAIWQRTRELNGADWELVRACAGNAAGVVRFRTGAKNFSRIAGDGDLVVEAHDVYPEIARADLVKVNIEGSEWEILEDERLAATGAVWIVEYHRIHNPVDDITGHVQQLFARAGYTTHLTTTHEDNGLVWAWR